MIDQKMGGPSLSDLFPETAGPSVKSRVTAQDVVRDPSAVVRTGLNR
jgi:hypothetical protein